MRAGWGSAAGAALLVVLLGGLSVVGCGGPSEATRTDAPRVIVLGFDGLDWELTRRLMAEGRLPNLQRLAARGVAQPLGTSIPPLSPVAWSDFITGMDPGGHGIFDFVHRDPKTLLPYLSTSRTTPPDRVLELGSWCVPLSGGGVELLRHGTAFWEPLAAHGVPTAILRMPANFPPSGTAHHELSGMGTPDLLGTYGTFSFYSSDPFFEQRSVGGGNLYPLDYWDAVATGSLVGPPNPFRCDEEVPLEAEFSLFVDTEAAGAVLELGDERRLLHVDEWSDWVPFEFDLVPTQSLPGMARFYLRAIEPEVELYVSPINIDPVEPALPVSTPPGYAAQLAERTGRFYTQGLPEDTKAITEDVLEEDEFLRQARIATREIVEQYWPVLERHDSGLLFYYFGGTDQVAHIFWRSLDPQHPAYDPQVDPKYADVLPKLYEEMDRVVGRTMDRLGPRDLLVVMSDHGFSSWRRAVNLNTWLWQEGYLVLQRGREPGPGVSLFSGIDWSRTRAYAVGINALYLNLRSRERDGIVAPSQKPGLLREIAGKLERLTDPANGERMVSRAFITERAFEDRGWMEIGPDVVVGYAKTYRGSNASGLGEVPAELVVDNTDRWSGDHAMDPAVVPGVLFASRPLARPVDSLQDLAAALLAEYGIESFPARGASASAAGPESTGGT